MKVTFKLFATLQDYLPPEAKKANALSLELAATFRATGTSHPLTNDDSS